MNQEINIEVLTKDNVKFIYNRFVLDNKGNLYIVKNDGLQMVAKKGELKLIVKIGQEIIETIY